jgi:hypothetical protein
LLLLPFNSLLESACGIVRVGIRGEGFLEFDGEFELLFSALIGPFTFSIITLPLFWRKFSLLPPFDDLPSRLCDEEGVRGDVLRNASFFSLSQSRSPPCFSASAWPCACCPCCAVNPAPVDCVFCSTPSKMNSGSDLERGFPTSTTAEDAPERSFAFNFSSNFSSSIESLSSDETEEDDELAITNAAKTPSPPTSNSVTRERPGDCSGEVSFLLLK